MPTIWYCLPGLLVSGTVSPDEINRFVWYPSAIPTVYGFVSEIAAIPAAARTSAPAPTAATAFRLLIGPPLVVAMCDGAESSRLTSARWRRVVSVRCKDG